MNTNSVTFGSLTLKTVQNNPLWDLDKDGFINLDEFLNAVETIGYDFLDLSTVDKDKDKKVTQEEYDLWTQEEKINEICDEAKSKVAADLIGQDHDDIVRFLTALEEFKQAFLEQQKKENIDISEWADKFAQQLPAKYTEIKCEILQNSKSAMKERAVEKVIEKVNTEIPQNNLNFFGRKMNILSDNAKRLMSNILLKEADKFGKTYSGEDFENNLVSYLVNFLNTSDKEKLANAIFIWEKDFESIAKLPPETALKQMKDKARNLIMSVLENGITLTMGCVTIRTSVGITPALAQYKDVDTLLYAIKGIIKNLSEVSKLEEIVKEADKENTADEQNAAANTTGKEEMINFFRTFQAA